MRSNTTIARMDGKVNASAEKYRRARDVLKSLEEFIDVVGWRLELPKLRPADIRGMTEGLDGKSEGRRTLS